MASRKDIAAEQQRLKDAGFYSGPVDGVEGPSTREARKAQSIAASSATARTAEAEAKAAEARAKEAEARVKAIEAEAKAAKQKSDAENAGVDRATQIAMNVGAAAGGVGIGHAVASKIEKRQVATMEARATEARAIGAEARKVVAKGVKPGKAGAGQVAKLHGVVAAANKLDIGKVKGPKGLAAAGVLLAEAAISRFVVAPQLENETAREAVNSVATLGVFGATTILGERAIANATPTNLPAGKDLVAIEQARAIVGAKDTPKVEPDTPKPAKAKAPKAKAPALSTGDAASLDRMKSLTAEMDALAKPSAAKKVAGVAGKVASGAAKFALPIIAGVAGATTFARTGSAAEAGKAAGDVVTSGGVSYYDQARSAGMSKPRALAEATVRGAYSMATFGIFDKKLTVPGSTQAKVEKVRARVANFPRQVQSQGRADFRNGLLEIAGGQRINDANPNPASRARERVRMGIEAAPLTRGLSDAQKRDYAKATQSHKAAAEKRRAQAPKSDGMTDAYVRTQNGKTVQVGGYRTVLPK